MRYFIVSYYMEDSRYGNEVLINTLVGSKGFPNRNETISSLSKNSRFYEYILGITGITEVSKEDAMLFFEWEEKEFSKFIVNLK